MASNWSPVIDVLLISIMCKDNVTRDRMSRQVMGCGCLPTVYRNAAGELNGLSASTRNMTNACGSVDPLLMTSIA